MWMCASCRRPVVDQGIMADPKMRESIADTMQGLSSAMSWSSAAHSSVYTRGYRWLVSPSLSTDGCQIDLRCLLGCPMFFWSNPQDHVAHTGSSEGNPDRGMAMKSHAE